MKIALLSYEYPPETGFGGIGTYTWYHARALARLGHDVHVLAGALAASELRREEHDEVTVFRHRRGTPWPRAQDWLDRRSMWWTKNRVETSWSMRDGLRKLLDRNRYDVVEMPECGGEGALLARRLGVPRVVRFHSPARLIMGGYDLPPLDRRLCAAIEQRGIDRAEAFTACSRFLAGEVTAKLGVRGRVEVIPNGIDLDLFDAGAAVAGGGARAKFGIPAGRPMVLFAGRLERRKGIDVAKEVAARILARREIAFVFAGQDLFEYGERHIRPALEALSLRGSFHLLGRLDLEGVRACLREADVFLIPSRWENCPYSCLEAMAAGRAIVSSNAGGLPELICDGETGLLAPVGDVDATAGAVLRLIEDDDLRRRLGASARRAAEGPFSDVAVARRAVECYRLLASGTR